MQVTPTNGDYRYANPTTTSAADSHATIDDAFVATIAQHVMAALPGLAAAAPAPSAVVAASSTKSSWLYFTQALANMVAASPEFRALIQEVLGRVTGEFLKANGIESVDRDKFATLPDGYLLKTKGATVARVFWWGFHIQISHEDLQAFLGGAGTVNTIVDAIGGNIPSPAQPFIKLAAVFVAGALGLLRALDRGRGVYVSMSWFAPGIFVPTTVV